MSRLRTLPSRPRLPGNMKRRWRSRVVRGMTASRPSSSGRATFRNTARCTRIRGLPRSCAKWIHLKRTREGGRENTSRGRFSVLLCGAALATGAGMSAGIRVGPPVGGNREGNRTQRGVPPLPHSSDEFSRPTAARPGAFGGASTSSSAATWRRGPLGSALRRPRRSANVGEAVNVSTVA